MQIKSKLGKLFSRIMVYMWILHMYIRWQYMSESISLHWTGDAPTSILLNDVLRMQSTSQAPDSRIIYNVDTDIIGINLYVQRKKRVIQTYRVGYLKPFPVYSQVLLGHPDNRCQYLELFLSDSLETANFPWSIRLKVIHKKWIKHEKV